MAEAQITGSHRTGPLPAIGCAIGLVLAVAVVFGRLRWTTGADGLEPAMGAASLFLGLVVFDLGAALVVGIRRRRGRAGSSSSLVGLTAVLAFIWLATTAVPATEPSNWTQRTAAALVVSAAGLLVEYFGVRRFDRVGRATS